ncbi:MAG: peptidase [Ignavibacteriae bacterium]|nr:peptidase [Ignavibacteriota bacterium]NOG96733.1 peptidase [Ignavibacteriota bacterium]
MKLNRLVILLFAAALIFGCSNNKDKEMLKEKIAQFAETEIKYDESLLDENQKIVVQKLYDASKIIDELFLEQAYSKNPEIKAELEKSKDEYDKLALEYFTIMFGPFDRLDHNKAFYGDYEKPKGANFYPEDMTKEEFESFIKDNPDLEKDFTSEFTVIRREDGKLKAIPYSEFYKDRLTKISALLIEASEYADNPTLKDYLVKRAKAFETNDYYESDIAWMDLKDHRIEVVIGPYEVYEDEMFNYKAAFETFLTLVDPVETEKLGKFASYLTDIEKNLPIPEKHKNYNRGSESPIVVVQEVFGAGDNKAGVQTLAFNLPNDERVRKVKGSKKVMIKNLHEAKFEKLLKPIAEKILVEDQLPYVTFESFFNHTLMHEMSHGVGPGFITIDGKETEVKKELKETYSTIEELKADILGMYNNIFMIEKGVFSKEVEKEIWVTFLAGTFRSVRFGISEAHGGGNAILYNYILEKGGYEFNSQTKKVSVNYDKIYDALKDLASEVLMIQAEGSYEGAKEMIAKYRVQSPSMKTIIEELSDLPVDIKPVYQIEK